MGREVARHILTNPFCPQAGRCGCAPFRTCELAHGDTVLDGVNGVLVGDPPETCMKGPRPLPETTYLYESAFLSAKHPIVHLLPSGTSLAEYLCDERVKF